MNKRVNIEDIYTLSPTQAGILFHTLYTTGSGTYIAQLSCTLHCELKVPVFQRTWQQMLDQHPILRTTFAWKRGGEPFQVVYRRVTLSWQEYDWQALSAEEQQEQLQALLQTDRR